MKKGVHTDTPKSRPEKLGKTFFNHGAECLYGRPEPDFYAAQVDTMSEWVVRMSRGGLRR